MTFFALLTKEMRLRLRRERTIWILITYILTMSLFGLLALPNATSGNASIPINYQLAETGLNLYILLSMLQLLLVLFITPSFTATAINGEKERQTYEMLLCSRLSSLALVSAKLIAGLLLAFLLIAASIPVFSLVFFFGGVALFDVIKALLVFIATTVLAGTFGLFCSAVCRRPALSTTIAYTVSVMWLILPIFVALTQIFAGRGGIFIRYPNRTALLFSWNPLTALSSTYPNGGVTSPLTYMPGMGYIIGGYGRKAGSIIAFGSWQVPSWLTYTCISLLVALFFFLVSMLMVRPHRGLHRGRSVYRAATVAEAT